MKMTSAGSVKLNEAILNHTQLVLTQFSIGDATDADPDSLGHEIGRFDITGVVRIYPGDKANDITVGGFVEPMLIECEVPKDFRDCTICEIGIFDETGTLIMFQDTLPVTLNVPKVLGTSVTIWPVIEQNWCECFKINAPNYLMGSYVKKTAIQ